MECSSTVLADDTVKAFEHGLGAQIDCTVPSWRTADAPERDEM